jgi:two-component system, OmpR family, sensor histidine kinase KdpD
MPRECSTSSSLPTGVIVCLASVAAITVAIYGLREVVPVVSTGVVYLLAVLLVSTYWGLWLGLLTAVLSAAAFNFFHIPPTGRFTIADGENWVALAVFLVAAIVVSTLASAARERSEEAGMRSRESALAADLARTLLGSGRLALELPVASRQIADALGLPAARLTLDDHPAGSREEAFPLLDEGTRVGTLYIPGAIEGTDRARIEEHVAPSLAALVVAARERQRLLAAEVEAEALRRNDEVKTALLRAVSHDLRSPLTAIVAAGEALSSSTLEEEERRELSGAVTGEAARLAELVDNLLDLSRLEAGAAEPRRDWCSLEEIARDAAEELGAASGQVKFSIRDDLPLVMGDAAQLQRAVANLLRNATRYSEGRPVSVRGALVGDRAVLRIVDQGGGISAADRPHVFEPFYRGRTDGGGQVGSGLGLAIVKGFVEANGGTVEIESVPGQGTTFVIEMPAERPAPAPTPARDER